MVVENVEPLKGERPWREWELLVLRLLRRLPRDDPHRKHAEQFLFDHGSGQGMALRGPAEEVLLDSLPAHVCETCGGTKTHFRLKGYRCPRCD